MPNITITSNETKYTGTATTTLTEYTYSEEQNKLILTNGGSVNVYIEIENDGQKTLLPGASYEFNTHLQSFKIKSLSGTASFTAISYYDYGNENDVKIDTRLRSLQAENTNLKVSTGHLANMSKGTRTRKGMVTFGTDDTRIQDWTVYKALSETHGIGFSTAAICNKIDMTATSLTDTNKIDATKVTGVQLKYLQDVLGWEVVSHGYSSDFTSLTDNALDAELKDSREWMIQNGFLGYDYVMIPYGYYDERVKRHIAKFYKGCRTTQQGLNNLPFNSYELTWEEMTTSTTVDARTGFAKNTLDHWKALIDLAIANEDWLIVGTHSFEIPAWGLTQLLSDVMAYAKTKQTAGDLEIVNYQQAFEKRGNIIDQAAFDKDKFSNHFILGSGAPKSNTGKTVLLKTDALTYTTSPADTEYIEKAVPNNKIVRDYISICPITASNSTIASFPEAKAGKLMTICVAPNDNYTETTNRYFYTQIWSPNGSQKIYTRGVKNSTTWHDFQTIGFESGCWNGIKNITTAVVAIGHDNNIVSTNGILEFEKILALTGGTTTPTLSKTLWLASELSTDSANPTVIGTVGAINLLCYLGTTRKPVLKYSTTGNNGDVYFRIHTC